MTRVTDRPVDLVGELTRLHRRVLTVETRLPGVGAGGGTGGPVAWDDVTGKPAAFPPEEQPLNWLTDVSTEFAAPGQVLGYDGSAWSPVDVDDSAAAAWEDITGKPATFAPTPQALDWLTDASGVGAIDGKLLGYASGQWVPVDPPVAVGGIAPVGTVMMWGAAVPPVGWLACDGAAVSRTTYADLFTVIGTTWGPGDGTTTFNVPNLTRRFALGAGAGTSPAVAASGGAWDHTHTGPSHTHTIASGGSHKHEPIDGASTNVASGTGNRLYTHSASGERHTHDHPNAGVHDHNAATGSAGTGASGPNNPPWLGIAFVIKATPGGADSGESTIAWADITGKPAAFPPVAQPLGWLTDVDTTTVADGQVLAYAAGVWSPTDPAVPAPQPLDWLTDVEVAAPVVGQVLVYDGTKWVPGAGGGGGGSVAWADITGKPATFPPSAHSNTAHNPSYVPTTGGNVTGILNMQGGGEIQNLPKPDGNAQPLRVSDGYSIESIGLGPTIHIGTGAPSGGNNDDVWLRY